MDSQKKKDREQNTPKWKITNLQRQAETEEKETVKLQNSHREDNTIASVSVYISLIALNANRILVQHSQWHGNHGEGNGNPLQSSCLENPVNGGAWLAAVHGVAKSQTWLSNFTFTFHFYALEKNTPVFLSGKSYERRRLMGCHLWGRTESDTTEAT